jgi:hypothetical protein
MSSHHHPSGPPRIEQALRSALTSQGRHEVMETVGWDKSAVSRFLDGQQGVPIDKLDKLVGAVGFVLVTREYLDAIATLSRVGVNCECARAGQGECGISCK